MVLKKLRRVTLLCVAWCGWMALGPVAPGPDDAEAFSRGLGAKVRRMRDAAFAERFENARRAFTSRDYALCVREAALALDHASTPDQAAAAHELTASAYERSGDAASAGPHRAWLAQNRPR